MSLFEINLKGIEAVQRFTAQFPAQSAVAQRNAVNRAGLFAFAESSRQIRRNLNVSQGYIGSATAGNRLKIKQRATQQRPVVRIEARFRPVSMARFATNPSFARGRSKPIDVRVKPGQKRRIRNAFFVRLKRGGSVSQDNYNTGLVIRAKPGENIRNRYKNATPFGKHKNLFLLFGPSVDQIFRQVRVDIEPQIISTMVNEYFRQMERNFRG